MGWTTHIGSSRREIIAERTREQGNDKCTYNCLERCIRGNILWTVWEIRHSEPVKTERFIGCDIIGVDGDGSWGYKDMEEASGPYYYTCPLKYLEMTPSANRSWRQQVRLYHKRRRALKPGVTAVFHKGCCVDRVKVTGSRRGKLVGVAEDGIRYAFRKSQVAEVISADCVPGGK